MISWPELGARVSVRYRRPAGSVPPLTDVIGTLLEAGALIRVHSSAGDVVSVAADDVVSARLLSDRPVRASDIRAVEHADAMAWPGIERQWLDGWLLRAGPDDAFASNSAVPLEFSANQMAIPAIVGWYRDRGKTPRLAIPDRLLRMSDVGEEANRLMVCDPHPGPGADQADAVIVDAPDGTRWVGLSAVHQDCRAQLAWGASHGATRGYVRIPADDRAGATLARSLGFALHHHARYITLP